MAMIARRLTKTEKNQILKDFRIGGTANDLAKKYKCSANTINRTVKSFLSNEEYHLLKEERSKIKKDKVVDILGYQENIQDLYAKSHIICLPSYREGLPKSLIEAAAASRAVVTTDVPGCREVIIPKKTGLLVPVKDSQKLAEALQWLIEHPLERIEMGKAGRKLAENEFLIEKIVQNHLDIYNELLN